MQDHALLEHMIYFLEYKICLTKDNQNKSIISHNNLFKIFFIKYNTANFI